MVNVENEVRTLCKTLQEEGCPEIAQDVVDTIASGSTGTEIHFLLLGALRRLGQSGRSFGDATEKQRQKIIRLVEDVLAQ